MKLSDIVRDNNMARFSHLRLGIAYYKVYVNILERPGTYIFPLNIAELDHASIFRDMKAIHLMKWIKKAMEKEEFLLSNA